MQPGLRPIVVEERNKTNLLKIDVKGVKTRRTFGFKSINLWPIRRHSNFKIRDDNAWSSNLQAISNRCEVGLGMMCVFDEMRDLTS